MKYTEQLNIAYPIISLGFRHCNVMHAYKPEVPQEHRQLSLEKKPLSSHDHN